MEIKLLHNAWAALPKHMTKWKVLYFKPYNVSQMRGEAKRESGRKKGKAAQSHIGGQIIDTLRKQAIASPLPLVG